MPAYKIQITIPINKYGSPTKEIVQDIIMAEDEYEAKLKFMAKLNIKIDTLGKSWQKRNDTRNNLKKHDFKFKD